MKRKKKSKKNKQKYLEMKQKKIEAKNKVNSHKVDYSDCPVRDEQYHTNYGLIGSGMNHFLPLAMMTLLAARRMKK